MSRWRNTLILFVLALALGGYAWFISQPENAPAVPLPTAQPPAATNERVPLFPEANGVNVTRVELSAREPFTPTTLIQDEFGSWYQTVPTRTQLVTATLNTQMTTLATLTSRRVLVADANPLAAYGLAEPAYEIVLYAARADGTSVRYTLFVGDSLTTSDGYYVQRKGDDRVFIVAVAGIDAVIGLPAALPVFVPIPTPVPTPVLLPDN